MGLGALKRKQGAARNEMGKAAVLRITVSAALITPGFPQGNGSRRLALKDLQALGLESRQPPLGVAAWIARIANQDEVAQADTAFPLALLR